MTRCGLKTSTIVTHGRGKGTRARLHDLPRQPRRRAPQQRRPRRRLSVAQAALARGPRNARPRCHRLEMAARAAAAQRAVDVDRQVAQLAGHAVGPAHQAPAADHRHRRRLSRRSGRRSRSSRGRRRSAPSASTATCVSRSTASSRAARGAPRRRAASGEAPQAASRLGGSSSTPRQRIERPGRGDAERARGRHPAPLPRARRREQRAQRASSAASAIAATARAGVRPPCQRGRSSVPVGPARARCAGRATQVERRAPASVTRPSLPHGKRKGSRRGPGPSSGSRDGSASAADAEDAVAALRARALRRRLAVLHRDLLRVLDLDLHLVPDAICLSHLSSSLSVTLLTRASSGRSPQSTRVPTSGCQFRHPRVTAASATHLQHVRPHPSRPAGATPPARSRCTACSARSRCSPCDELAAHALSVRGAYDAGTAARQPGQHQQRRRLHLEVHDALARHLLGKVRKADGQLPKRPTLRRVEAGRRGGDAQVSAVCPVGGPLRPARPRPRSRRRPG